MTCRIFLVAAALAIGGATLEERPARGAGIGDIISDFLYLQEELKLKAPARPVAEVVAGIGDRYLGLIDVGGAVRIWDFETGGQIQVEGSRPPQVRTVFPNPRGANLILVEASGRVYETVGLSFAEKAILLGDGSASDAVAVSPRAPVVAAAGGGRLQLYNLVTKQIIAISMPARVSGLWVSEDGRFVAYEAGSVSRVLDADRGVSLPLEPAGPASKIRFYYDSTGASRVARQDSPTRLTLYKFDGRGFSSTGDHKFGTAPRDFWIGRDAQVYWTNGNALNASPLGAAGARTVFDGKEPIVSARHVSVGADLLIVQRSGLLGVLSAKTGKIVATAISTENGWVVLDSNKRYDGSARGGREIAWVVQKVDLDLEKFARHFYEPGLLLRYLGGQPPAFASAGHQGPIPTPPSISHAELLQNVAGAGVTVVLATARNVKEDVAGIEVYHNGKRVSETARITEETKQQNDLKFRSAGYQIHPAPGPNTVAVFGVGRLGIEGPTRDLAFDRPGATSGALHALMVGIDLYGLASLKLGYARRDAEAIAQLMRVSKGFDRVAVSELYDAHATRESILTALRSAAASASPGDAIVVYLAGHGIVIRGGWYFLSPVLTDVNEDEIVRLSISAEQIAATLKESKATRIVLMIDACHSGAVVNDVKGLLQNRLYTQLGRATGFVVLAAARRDQAARERATLGHGVFTAAAVAALSGAADRNGDGRVTARELAAYLSRQIPTLATEHLNEIQIPVAYAPSEDFVIRSLR
jgi:hypothetical protein